MKIGKANIAQQKDEKIKLLEETLKFKLEIEQNCIDFAKKLDQLNLFLEEVALSVSEPVRASSVKDVDTAYQIVNNLLKTHSDNKKTLQDAQEIHKKLLMQVKTHINIVQQHLKIFKKNMKVHKKILMKKNKL